MMDHLIIGRTYDISWTSCYTQTPCRRVLVFKGYSEHGSWVFEDGIVIRREEKPVLEAAV